MICRADESPKRIGLSICYSAYKLNDYESAYIHWLSTFNCFIGFTYTSWRTTPVWFSYSHYRAFVGSIGVSPIGVRIYVYYQCLP
jgi:hypothetical protein